MKNEAKILPVGVILKKEFINKHKISQNALADAILVPPNRIHQIVKGTRKMTVDTDIRLAKFFGIEAGYFMNLETEYQIFKLKIKLEKELKKIDLVEDYKRKKSRL